MRIILLGPRGVGKTTVAKMIAEKLQFKYVSLDEEGRKLDFSVRQTLEGRAKTVKNVFKEYREVACVYDFGAFHSFYVQEQHLSKEVDCLLQPEANVFLLLPSSNIEESEKYSQK